MTTYDPTAQRSGFNVSENRNYNGVVICYIHGQYVPIVSFDVSSAVSAIPEFSIQVVSDPIISSLSYEDRVPVQLFYLDYWAEDTPVFRLLADGEIAGTFWGTSFGQRTRGFTCLAHINIFQALYFFFMNTLDDVVAGQDPAIRTTGLTVPGLFYPYSLFHTGLFTPHGVGEAQGDPPTAGRDRRIVDVTGEDDASTPNDDPISAPFELVYNVIKGLVGNTIPESRRSLPAVNFFGPYVRKMRLHRRFVRLPILEDLQNLADRHGVFPIFAAVRSDEALAAMQRQIAGTIGNSGSIWQMLQSALSMVYMEISMVMNAGCFRTNLQCEIVGTFSGGSTTQAQVLSNTTDALGQEVVSETAQRNAPRGFNPQQPATLAQYCVKPQFLFGIPPSCNVIYPSMTDNLSGRHNYRQEPTRMYVQDSVMTQALRAQGAQRDFMLHALTVAWPPEADEVLHMTVGQHSGVSPSGTPGHTLTGKNLLIYPTEVWQGPNVARLALPRWFQFLQQLQNTTATGTTGPTVATPTAPTTTTGVAVSTSATQPTAPNPLTTTGVPGPANLNNRGDWTNRPDEISSNPVRDNRTSVTNQTASVTIVTPSAGPVVSTRGRIAHDARFDIFNDLWEMDDETLQIMMSRRPIQYDSSRGTSDFLSLAQARTRIGQSRQMPISPGITALANYVVRNFQVRTTVGNLNIDWVGSYGFARPESGPRGQIITQAIIDAKAARNAASEHPLPESEINMRDSHHEGRAFDCAIRLSSARRGTPAIGNPIANWLVRNAHLLGIQNICWGRRWYLASAGPNRRYNNMVNDAFRDNSSAHVDHIHFEINDAGMQGNLQWYRDPEFQASIPPPRFEGLENLVLYTSESGSTGPSRRTGTRGTRTRTTSTSTNGTQTTVTDTRTVRAQVVPNTSLVQGLEQRISVRTLGASTSTLVRTPQATPITLDRPATPQTTRTTETQIIRTAVTDNSAPQETPASSPGANPNQPIVSSNEGTFQSLYRLYTQQEFLRQKYLARAASVMMRWNPYVIQGYPCVVFDRMTHQEHFVGYIDMVKHSGVISDTSCLLTTTISVSCYRHFPEFIQDVIQDSEFFSQRLIAAPADAIKEIRDVIQSEDQAELFYKRLLYGGEDRPDGLSASFNFMDALGYPEGLNAIRLQNESTEITETVPVEEGPPPEGETMPTEPTTRVTRRVQHTLDPNRQLVPLPGTLPFKAFDNYDTAMKLAARPICTLDQYIRFWHAGATIQALIASGDVAGENDYFTYAQVIENDVVAQRANGETIRGNSVRKPAVFYERIFRLRPGPGEPLSEQQRGYTTTGPSANTAGLPENYPQSRADWDAILTTYKNNVRLKKSPNT